MLCSIHTWSCSDEKKNKVKIDELNRETDVKVFVAKKGNSACKFIV